MKFSLWAPAMASAYSWKVPDSWRYVRKLSSHTFVWGLTFNVVAKRPGTLQPAVIS